MKFFSFANLGARGARAESDGYEDDDERAKDEDDRAEDEDQQDDAATSEDEDDDAAMDDAEDGSDDDGGEDDDDEGEDDGEQSAAFKRGAAAARKRIGAILSGPNVGAHNFAQAADIACNMPQVTAKQAARLLAAAPAPNANAGSGGGLAAAMRGRHPKPPARGDRGGARGNSIEDRIKARYKKKEG